MLPASQFANGGPGSTFGFALPSGNVICSGTSTSLLCETKFSVPVPLDDTCGVYDRQDETNATIFGWADFDKPLCATERGNNQHPRNSAIRQSRQECLSRTGIHDVSSFRLTSPRRLLIMRHVITALMTLVTSIMARVARLLVA